MTFTFENREVFKEAVREVGGELFHETFKSISDEIVLGVDGHSLDLVDNLAPHVDGGISESPSPGDGDTPANSN